METNSNDYKTFLRECQTAFKCSVTEAEAIAKEYLRREKRKAIISAVIIYGLNIAIPLIIFFFIKMELSRRIILSFFSLLTWFGVGSYIWIDYNCGRHNSDYYGIPAQKVEKIKNQVLKQQ